MNMDKEQELVACKLRNLEAEARQHNIDSREAAIQWVVKFGLANLMPNVPRMDQLAVLVKLLQTNEQLFLHTFGQEISVLDMFDHCRQLYDYAFLVEQFVKVRGQQALGSSVILNKLQKKFMELFQKNQDSQTLLYLQGLNMYISMSQSSAKEPAASFLGLIFSRQRQQASSIYRWVIKPLFEKKNLKSLYTKLVDLVTWLIFMSGSWQLVNDLSKKLNSFLLYYKGETSIEMISVCNRLFDLLSVHFPREAKLNHSGLAALLVKLRGINLSYFLDMWLEARVAFINTLDFEYLLRNLTLMGTGNLVLDVLGCIWTYMRRNGCYSVLLKIFSGYIRKQYLKLWLQRGQDLSRYLKLAKFFMVGLCNRQRFQGEQIDQLTNNLCLHLIHRGSNFSLVYKEIIQFYALYENRFSYLSETSKRFFWEIKERYNTTIQTAAIHERFNELTIRELTNQEEQEYWQKGKVSLRYRGLENLGNTCYMNSFMQCLFMTRKFRAFVYQITKDDALPSSQLKAYALQNLFMELSKKQIQHQNPFRPQYFRMELSAPFNTTPYQQDTAQFGRIYLEDLQRELGAENGGKMQKLLTQKLFKTIRCLNCNSQKKQQEKVYDLILNIDRQDTELYLSKLIKHYFSSEKFTDENKVFCQKCGSKQEALTELFPGKFSEVVVLTLSLFDYVGEGRKILTPLMFQFSLNFEVLLNHPNLGEYQLYAFIVHLGSNLGGGHYICYARNLQQNPIVWYCLDDGYVTEREIGKVQDFGFGQNETPYMLFYSRKQTAALRGKPVG